MANKLWGVFKGATLVVALLLMTSCDLQALEIGPVQTKSELISLEAADTVMAEIVLGAGRLEISSGAEALLDADFTYNIAEWEPEVNYTVQDGDGRLTIRQPSSERKIPLAIDDVKYEWDLRFNESVPLNLSITMAAGEGELELDRLLLNRLEFQGGAGDVTVDLSGSSLTALDLRLGAGSVNLDLTGDWQQDLSGNIKGGVGAATLHLPSNVGVRVQAQGRLGSINASGLSKNGDIYTNDAYGQSDVTLDIDIETGIGEITLLAG